jgi:hypothetical protein
MFNLTLVRDIPCEIERLLKHITQVYCRTMHGVSIEKLQTVFLLATLLFQEQLNDRFTDGSTRAIITIQSYLL